MSLQCPKCGSTDSFSIEAVETNHGLAYVDADYGCFEFKSDGGEVSWEPGAAAQCWECEHEDKLGAFEVGEKQ